jgi:hypothetical protein
MKKFCYASVVVALMIVGCGSPASESGSTATSTPGSSSTASTNPKDQLVGNWKVDMEASKLGGMTDKEKEEGASIRTELKADGTFESKSSKDEGKGTWKLDGKTVTFEGSNIMPPTMTLSDDGKTLTFSMTEGGQEVAIIMVKG